MYNNILNILGLILNLIGAIILVIPLVRSKRDLDDDLVILKEGAPKPGEDDKKYYTTIGFLKDRKWGLFGLGFLGFGFFIQINTYINIDLAIVAMEDNLIVTKIIFLVIAVILSITVAWHMVSTFGAKKAGLNQAEVLHDYIFNFFGALLGWFSAYYFIFYRLGNEIEITDLVIIFIAFVGVTGYLPHIIINKGFKP